MAKTAFYIAFYELLCYYNIIHVKYGGKAMGNGSGYGSKKIIFNHRVLKNAKRDTYSTHTHNTYELIYFLDGDATHVIEDRRYKLRRGDLIIIRPLQYHFIHIDSESDYERYDILIDPEAHGIDSGLIKDCPEIVNILDNPLAVSLFERLDFYRGELEDRDFDKLFPSLLTELFYILNLTPYKKDIEAMTASALLTEALRYINDNLCTLSGISEIAKKLFISESYLFRLFKSELHQTPKKYIRDKRLLMAQRMISEGKKPIIVYEKCGFSDYTAFYRSYISYFGHAPSKEKHS